MPDSNPGPLPQKSGALPTSHHISLPDPPHHLDFYIYQEVLLPNNNVSGPSTFYTNDGDSNFLMEDDNFFEDMTSLYRKQKVLFQRSCEQLKVSSQLSVFNTYLRAKLFEILLKSIAQGTLTLLRIPYESGLCCVRIEPRTIGGLLSHESMHQRGVLFFTPYCTFYVHLKLRSFIFSSPFFGAPGSTFLLL